MIIYTITILTAIIIAIIFLRIGINVQSRQMTRYITERNEEYKAFAEKSLFNDREYDAYWPTECRPLNEADYLYLGQFNTLYVLDITEGQYTYLINTKSKKDLTTKLTVPIIETKHTPIRIESRKKLCYSEMKRIPDGVILSDIVQKELVSKIVDEMLKNNLIEMQAITNNGDADVEYRMIAYVMDYNFTKRMEGY